jgi:hypothetical protein
MSGPPHYARSSLEEGGAESDHPSNRPLTFDAAEGAYVARFDNSTASPSTTVVLMIAKMTGQRSTDLRPLCHVVDPDVLNRIVGGRASGEQYTKRLVHK